MPSSSFFCLSSLALTHLLLRLSAGLTDRYGMPVDIASKVIKTDSLGRQEVYHTDRYGMPIGDPVDEKVLE